MEKVQKNKNDFSKNINKLIKNSDAIIISDYNKGSITNIPNIINIANKKKPIFIDPKGDNFVCYKKMHLRLHQILKNLRIL